IEDVQLVLAHQVDAAVAAALVLVMRRIGLGPLHMQLTVAEGLFGVNVAGPRCDHQDAINALPLRRASLFVLPLREVLAVKEDNGVRGRSPRRFALAVATG